MAKPTPTYTKGSLYQISCADLQTDPSQPRKYFDPDAQQDLVNSLQKRGVLQPILFRADIEDNNLFIVAGERRLQAAKDAGLENILAYFFDRASDGMMVADTITKKFIQANTAICSMLGYTKEEIKSLTISDIHPPEEIPHVLDEFNLMAKEEKVLAKNLPVLRKDGSIFYADISSSHAIIGGVRYLLGIFRDITDRNRSEQALSRTEADLNEAQRIGRLGSWDWDATNDIITWSEEYCHILGFDPTQRPPRYEEHLKAYTLESAARLDAAVKRSMQTGEPYELDLEFVHTDGQRRWITARGEAKRDTLGKIYGLCGTAHDITTTKLAEEVLKEALEKYRSLAAYVDSMYLVDRDCTYLFMNERHLKRFGLSLEEVIGKKYSDFHSEGESRQFAESVSEVFKTGKPSTIEHKSERHEDFIIRTFSPIIGRDTNGEISQVAIISKNITSIKLAEKKLQDTLESLRKALNTTIQVMVSAVEVRDPYTSGHQMRSANLARAIATEMGLSPEKIEGIRMAGSIHDIGKLSIPAEILSKPTKLSEIEFSLIKEHSRRGFEMLKDVESPWPLAEIVYQHHERMDGSGYPRNLKGEEICIEARILNVADVVEAMASHRPYRPSLGIDEALNEIEKNRGIFYDKTVADACLRLFREKGFKLEECDYKQ